MKNLVNWITVNPIIAFVIFVIVIALIVYIYTNKKGLIYKSALYAVAKAEDAWGSNTGKIKFAEVYIYLKSQYPLITFFFTEKQLTKIIEDALIKLKEILAVKESKENETE